MMQFRSIIWNERNFSLKCIGIQQNECALLAAGFTCNKEAINRNITCLMFAFDLKNCCLLYASRHSKNYVADPNFCSANSCRACLTTDHAPVKPNFPIKGANAISGHTEPVPNTPNAARMTAIFLMASLLEHNHTERILASLSR